MRTRCRAFAGSAAVVSAAWLLPACAAPEKAPTETGPRVMKTLGVKNPVGVAVSADGYTIYVSQPGTAAQPGKMLTYLAADSGAVLGTITVDDRPTHLLMSPDGSSLYAACEGTVRNARSDEDRRSGLTPERTGGTVVRVDTAQNTVGARFQTGRSPVHSTLSGSGDTLAVTDHEEGVVSLLSLSQQKVFARIAVGYRPWQSAFYKDGSVLFTSGGGGVGYYRSATGQAVARLAGNAETFGIAVAPDGRHVYVADRTASKVLVVDPATATFSASISVGAGPTDMAVTSNGSWLYVVCETGNEVDVISTATNEVVSQVFDVRLPGRIALSPDSTLAYVTMPVDDRVAVIATHDWVPMVKGKKGKKRAPAQKAANAADEDEGPNPWEQDDRDKKKKKP